MVSANHDLGKVAGLDSLDSTETQGFFWGIQIQCIFIYWKQRRVVLPSQATPGQSSPRPLVRSQPWRMVLPAVTRRKPRERERDRGESEDPREAIQSPNTPKSQVSPQPGLSRDFWWGRRKARAQREEGSFTNKKSCRIECFNSRKCNKNTLL
jgi:hypothetical protein